MIDFRALFKSKQKSGSVAKDRLQLVLIHDRLNCSDEIINNMREDILAVISKYVEIDMEEFELQIDKVNDGEKVSPVLCANIPIKSMKRPIAE